MKLISLQIFPNGKFGWESNTLIFGRAVTQLYGPNGCGKTPIVQSIAYCLGYPCKFRNDIYDKCSHAILEVEINKRLYKFKRKYIQLSVEIEVITSTGLVERFFDEKEYSLFIFDLLDIEVNNLVGNSNQVITPYLATLLPIFYLDQDDGYNKYYSPPSKFIKDQFSEMVRLIFKLPAKNLFDAKKGRIEAKQLLDYLDETVHKQARDVDVAKENALSISKNMEDISAEISALEAELDGLKNSGANYDDSIAALDKLISGNLRNIREIKNELLEITKREKSINHIITEINTEIETLNINEEAKRVFLAFNEICGSNNCQLFSISSESYSKNLLYLKDQIKDLERNSLIDNVRKRDFLEQIRLDEEKIEQLVKDKQSAVGKSEISVLIDAISAVKNKIFDLKNQYDELNSIETLKEKYFKSVVKRNSALDKYESFSSGGVTPPQISRLKSKLKELFVKWLDVLNTKNIRREITFKDEFSPVLGDESIDQLKGSTRTRAVLAFHAALIELMIANKLDAFNFFILDTPKQHEVHNDDLNCFMLALKEMADKNGIQIIFSTTEYHYECDSSDSEWTPKFAGDGQDMFLRVLNGD